MKRVLRHDSPQPDRYYSFGPFQLNPQSRVLTKAGVRVPITAKAVETLLVLVERRGETLTKAELRAAVWGGSAVDENNLNQCISAIRKALGERPDEHEYILTVTGVGYRFIAPVASTSQPGPELRSKPLVSPAASSNRRLTVVAVMAAILFALLASAWIAHRVMLARADAKPEPFALSRNRQALELYTEGRRIIRGRQAPDLKQAVQFFQDAVAKDPNFALGYAWLAETYAIQVANGLASPDSLELGEAAATKALALDPSLADAHASLGLLKYSHWDWRGADREYTTALRLDSNNSRALMRSAMVSFVMGRFSEAESRLGRAQVLDPSNGAIPGMVGELYYYQRRYDDSIRQAEHIMQFDPPNVSFACDLKARALLQEGRIPQARIAAQKAAELVPDHVGYQLMLAWLNSNMDSTKFLPILRRVVEPPTLRYTSPYVLAVWYATARDEENTFRQLEIAYQQRVTDLISLRWDPRFDSIRGDPRYTKLLARMGFPKPN